METKKRKYVKPKLTVAEWDFNEAVCQDGIMVVSNCITSEKGEATQYHVNADSRDEITWGTYNGPIGNNSRW